MENSQAPQGIKDIQLSSKKRSIIRPECNILVIYQKSKNSVEGQSLEESIIEAYNKVITKPYLRNFDAKCLEFAQVGFSQDIDKTSEEYKNIAKLFNALYKFNNGQKVKKIGFSYDNKICENFTSGEKTRHYLMCCLAQTHYKLKQDYFEVLNYMFERQLTNSSNSGEIKQQDSSDGMPEQASKDNNNNFVKFTNQTNNLVNSNNLDNSNPTNNNYVDFINAQKKVEDNSVTKSSIFMTEERHI